MIAGSQKALALPPGLSLVSVSKRALDRASEVAGRGYYFDLLEFQKNHENGMTPSTPIIPIIYALKSKLEDIRAEGIPARYARHARLNKAVRDWAVSKGFKLFPADGYGSVTLNCFANNLGLRPAGPEQDPQGEAPARDRRRLRQTEGEDLPDFEHGRRDGCHDRGPRRGARQRARGDAESGRLKTAPRKLILDIMPRGAYRLAAS